MIVEVSLKLVIDIDDYVTVFSSPNGLLQVLKRSFEGKCHGGYFVMEILRVVESGYAFINYTHTSKPVTVRRQVIARCITYGRGDIINGCKVIQIEDAAVYCMTSTESIIANPRGVHGVKVGDLISIVVAFANYPRNEKTITINGDAFAPMVKPIYYRLAGEPTADLMRDLEARVAAALAKYREIPKEMESRAKNFEQLLGPVAKRAVVGKEVELGAFVSELAAKPESAGTFVAIDPAVGVSTLSCIVCDRPPEGSTVVVKNIDDAIADMIRLKTGLLGMISAYLSIYDATKFAEHKGLWMYYRSVLKALPQ